MYCLCVASFDCLVVLSSICSVAFAGGSGWFGLGLVVCVLCGLGGLSVRGFIVVLVVCTC